MVRLYKIGQDGLKSKTDYIDIAPMSLVKAFWIAYLISSAFVMLGFAILYGIIYVLDYI